MLRALAFNGLVRAVVAETTTAVESLRQIHDPSPTVTAAMGRVATGALLLAATLEKVTRREPVLTVRFAGDGPVGNIVATASPRGWVRCLVDNPHASAPARPDGKLDVRGVVGSSGTLEVARDVGSGVPYSGIVPIVSGEIGEDFAHYLNESEQTPSAVALGVFVVPQGKASHAGGYLIQLLPGLADETRNRLERRIRKMDAVTTLFRNGVSPDDLVERLFPEGCQILDRQQVDFRCGCSMEKVERALKLLGSEEVRSLWRQSSQEPVSLTCHFCRSEYAVSPQTLQRLLDELRSDAAGEIDQPQA